MISFMRIEDITLAIRKIISRRNPKAVSKLHFPFRAERCFPIYNILTAFFRNFNSLRACFANFFQIIYQ